MSLFYNDTRSVIVSEGSDYYDDLDCEENLVDGHCEVFVSNYVNEFFGGRFSRSNIPINCVILGGILLVVRASTFFALGFLTYTGK